MTKARSNRLTKAEMLKAQIEGICRVHGIVLNFSGNLWKFEIGDVKFNWHPLNNTFYISGEGHRRHLKRLNWLRCKQSNWILDGLRELAGSRRSLNTVAAPPLRQTPPVASQQSNAPASPAGQPIAH